MDKNTIPTSQLVGITSMKVDYFSDVDIHFIPMTEIDMPKVMSVENSVYSFPWSQQIFIDCIRSGYQCWMMKADDRLIGHSVLSAAAGEAHLLNISVHHDYQRKGLGRRFLRFMLKQAQSLRVEEVFLEVRVSNKHAHQLYFSEGFNEIGQRKGYYPAGKTREDALVLAFNL